MMRKAFSLAATALAAVLVNTELIYGADLKQQSGDSQLNSAVQEYIQCRKQQDYKCVWRLLSRRTKEGNDNDQAGYEKYVKDHGFHSSDLVVEKTVESGSTALITVTVTYVENATEKRLGGAREEWKFVKEDGVWLLDEYKTLSESP